VAPRWQNTYRSKLTTPEGAVASVGRGEVVYMGGNAATPRVLARALAQRGAEVSGSRVAHVLLLGEDPLAEAVAAGHLKHLTYFVGPGDRRAMLEGRAEYVPTHLSEIPRLLRSGNPQVDTALLMTSPPDRHGLLSLGVEVLASLAAAETAKQVVVQVNEKMPRVFGNSFIHVDDVDAIVEADEPLVELLAPEPDEVEQKIAERIVSLIPQGGTLQLGIGGIPNAVVSLLGDRDDLGVHSEMISDGVMHAWESGVVSGRYKTQHRGQIITTFALGSSAFYEWLHENPIVEAHPCDHTNDPRQAAQNDRLVSINSAISIDLTGQVNADSIGYQIYSGVGGQVDFVRAANRSREGRSIIALPSTARGGEVSRIVLHLAEGAGVVTSRADVHTVVTEYGVAELYGKSIRERVYALIEIAHPAFRDELLRQVDEVVMYFRERAEGMG
jgi:4-hydroxybutyrate CoA-transferase